MFRKGETFMDMLFWAFALAFCTLVLVLEAVRMAVALLVSRQPLWRYLFVLFPLAVSTVSFLLISQVFVRWDALYALSTFLGRVPSVVYEEARTQLFQLRSPCQHQLIITLIALVATIVLERYLLPSGTTLLSVGKARDRFLASQVSLSRRYL